MCDEVWSLKIEYSGAPDRVLHESLHETPRSAREKAERVLRYDVPAFDEWYVRPNSDDYETQYVGYVLDRDEIDSWPIRIEAHRTEILNVE